MLTKSNDSISRNVRWAWCVAFVAVVLATALACDRRASNPAAIFGDVSIAEIGDQRRDQETIERSLGVLFSMENYPDLPGLVGEETLTAMVDRLNKWLQGKKIDEFWSPEPQLESLAQLARQNAEAVKGIVDLLHTIQGDVAADSAATRAVSGSGEAVSLATQSGLLIERLTATESLLRPLIGELETTSLNDLVALLQQLRTKWQQLASMSQPSDGAVRAFARQLTDETQAVETLARTLDLLASGLDTRALRFSTSDMLSLKGAAWMRQIAQWGRGTSHREIDQAQALFDWAVRNIDVHSETIRIGDQQAVFPVQEPWQTVLLGSGTRADRAWVFVELLRQQRIEACLLSIPETSETSSRLTLWSVGVLIDGELFLFLVDDGLPVPGKSGVARDSAGGISIPEVATLREFVADPALRQRIVRAGSSLVSDQQLAKLTAHLVITPTTTAARNKILEKECAGDFTMVLFTPPRETQERFSALPHLHRVEVWRRPLTACVEAARPSGVVAEMLRPLAIPSMKTQKLALWRGRVLYLRGRLAGQESAAAAWQDAITPDRVVLDLRNAPVGAALPGLDQMLALVNTMATYWLGHAAFAQGNWESARNYFEMRERLSRRTFGDTGRRYMLGRLDEREGKFASAAEFYRQSGHHLRAAWLESTPNVQTTE